MDIQLGISLIGESCSVVDQEATFDEPSQRIPETGNGYWGLTPPDRAHQQGRRRPFPVIVDVREEARFVLGHIDGAKRISPDSLEESIRDVVPDLAIPIVVYCAAGAPGGTLMLEVGISSRPLPSDFN